MYFVVCTEIVLYLWNFFSHTALPQCPTFQLQCRFLAISGHLNPKGYSSSSPSDSGLGSSANTSPSAASARFCLFIIQSSNKPRPPPSPSPTTTPTSNRVYGRNGRVPSFTRAMNKLIRSVSKRITGKRKRQLGRTAVAAGVRFKRKSNASNFLIEWRGPSTVFPVRLRPVNHTRSTGMRNGDVRLTQMLRRKLLLWFLFSSSTVRIGYNITVLCFSTGLLTTTTKTKNKWKSSRVEGRVSFFLRKRM